MFHYKHLKIVSMGFSPVMIYKIGPWSNWKEQSGGKLTGYDGKSGNKTSGEKIVGNL
jgi:Rps23 Pro-64 3,4-dihydroxylase Tpa1-like proline 4-hydroxylase